MSSLSPTHPVGSPCEKAPDSVSVHGGPPPASLTLHDRREMTQAVDVLQLLAGVTGRLKDREERTLTGNLQVAADGAGADSLCGALVSAVLALAPRCRRVARRARSGGGSHDDLALGATIRSQIGTATAASS